MFVTNPEAVSDWREFARKLLDAAGRHEASFDPETATYRLTMLEAANGDEQVSGALTVSWNESLDWAKGILAES